MTTEPKSAQSSQPRAQSRSLAAEILIDAGLSAFVALVLALPIVGIETRQGQFHLGLVTHWDHVAYVVIGTFLVRLAVLAARSYRQAREVAQREQHKGNPKRVSWLAKYATWFGIAGFAVAVILPFVSSNYIIDLGTSVLIYVMLGWGLNIVVGLAGLLDLGYVAFYGVGAYTVGLLSTDFNFTFWECLPLAGIIAAFFGIVLGFPVLRLRGDYLAIVTLGFGEIIRIILLNWQVVTNGPNGINDIPRPTLFGLVFQASAPEGQTTFADFFHIDFSPSQRLIFLYFVILVLALITNFFTLRMRRLPVGRAWEALREDEIACRAMGINATNIKLSAFAMGAMFGGFAGAFFATRLGFISPESFTFAESATILAIVVLGGMGSQLGVVLAAVILVTFPEIFRPFADYRMLLFGAAMVTIMVVRPRGLLAFRKPTLLLRRKADEGIEISREAAP
ncbi:MAG TPA: high-affinity branched-chain amino acid ABC transporter permease LivM [Stellaceae bacterium]|jgi:branched-chain amino acid transport system permease protein|nr:high-affinity branched-chain amino acid ABC transporter permease LivM [Stellaceae bacterium]